MRDRTISIVSVVAILTIFMAFWKIAGMPPGTNGDYLDLFDDAVALSGPRRSTSGSRTGGILCRGSGSTNCSDWS